MPKGDPFKASLSSFSSLDRKMKATENDVKPYHAVRREYLHLIHHRVEFGRHWEISRELVEILMNKLLRNVLGSLDMKPRKRSSMHENARQFTSLFDRACKEEARRRDRSGLRIPAILSN